MVVSGDKILIPIGGLYYFCQCWKCHTLTLSPQELVKWTLPFSNWDISSDANCNVSQNTEARKANKLEPDELARDEPSRLDLHYLQKYLFCLLD